MTGESLAGKQNPSIYAQLSEAVTKRHARVKSHIVEGSRRPYSILAAAEYVIARCKLSPTQIFSELIKKAVTTPNEVNEGIGFAGPSWDDFQRQTSVEILWRDLYELHPEIVAEDERREAYWSNRSKRQNP